jgi:DNA-binding transcriptional ArsR family regulator
MAVLKSEEILRLYDDEHLTQKQISYRLGIAQQTVSYHIKKSRKNNPKKSDIGKGGMVSHHIKSLWSYHALHFLVYPYWFFPRYHRIRTERGNQFIINREWKYKLNQDSVELRLRRGFDFLDEDKFEAIAKAEDSLNRTLYEISNSCGFQYEKEGRVSIKLVKQHLARQNSAFAKGTAKAAKKDYIQVKGIDGKVWFLIDKSKGFLEHEYVHAGRMMADSERIEGFIDELRQHKDLSLLELSQRQERTDQTLHEFSQQIKLHLEVLDRISKGMDKFSRAIDKLEKKL